MASDGTRGAGMNSLFQERSNKRNYSTMADGRRNHDDSTDHDHASSSLFVPEDDHYDNEHASARPRLVLPPLRFAGDGLDFRRPVTNSRASAAPRSNVIDLTDDDASQDSGQSMTATVGSSRAQRTPRYERDILNNHESSDNQSRPAQRESHQTNLRTQMQSNLLRQRMDQADTDDTDDIEVVLVRPLSRPRTMSRRQTPLSESTRSNTPRAAGADDPIDLTGDDDVVITDSRPREGGVNAARPGITAGLGTRSLADNAIATTVAAIFRHSGGQEGGRLWSYISRHGAGQREHQDLRSNTLGGDLLFAGPARVRHLPGRMDFAAVGFDMGLPEGNRPPSPKYEPPAAPGRGFTRNPKEDEEVVCPSCGDELAMGDDEVKQQVWVNKSCGHAYCGECAQSRGKSVSKKGKNRATDTNSLSLKKCIVMHCGKPVSKNGMIQVYLGS